MGGFSEETLSSIKGFFAYAVRNLPVPTEIGIGYWPTLWLYWENSKPFPITIEIIHNDFEMHRAINLVVDIREYKYSEEEGFPIDLAEILQTELH